MKCQRFPDLQRGRLVSEELVRNKSSSHNVKSDTGAQQREVVIPHVGNLSYLNHDMSHREGSNSISDD